MENNTFFAAVLRGLGYEVLTTGARVSNAANGIFDGGFTGWYVPLFLLWGLRGLRSYVEEKGRRGGDWLKADICLFM
jgi:hypothetical protein